MDEQGFATKHRAGVSQCNALLLQTVQQRSHGNTAAASGPQATTSGNVEVGCKATARIVQLDDTAQSTAGEGDSVGSERTGTVDLCDHVVQLVLGWLEAKGVHDATEILRRDDTCFEGAPEAWPGWATDGRFVSAG